MSKYFAWNEYYAAKIRQEWDALPTAKRRLRGKRGTDGKYHAKPTIVIEMLVEDAQMLCDGHMPDVELVTRLRKAIRGR